MSTSIGFGTSGIRGLAKELTDHLCYRYTCAFLKHLTLIGNLSLGDQIAIAGDRRASTPKILQAVAQAITDSGYQIINCGQIPTPALLLFGIHNTMPSIMVTGSHIAANRNGIKFFLSTQEILKEDEVAISRILPNIPNNLLPQLLPLPAVNDAARQLYVKRYLDFFPSDLLKDYRIGVYGHSAVGRDILSDILSGLSAQIVKLDYHSEFTAIDTEALSRNLVDNAQSWSRQYPLDAIVSTDGDGDRPMLADESGQWFSSDILDMLTAIHLGIDALVVPITCNTALEKLPTIKKVIRVRVGSPHVVNAANQMVGQEYSRVAGFEPNGGFLTFTSININNHTLTPLPTRDAIIVLLSVLSESAKLHLPLSKIASKLPARYTASLSIKNISIDSSQVQQLLVHQLGPIKDTNVLDGLRLIFQNDDIVHLRPSRNSPEFRIYSESSTPTRAQELIQITKQLINGS